MTELCPKPLSPSSDGPRLRVVRRRAVVVTGSLVATLLVASAAGARQADDLVVPAPAARNLAAGGGWMVWAVRDANVWRLVVRTPTGAIGPAPVRAFGAAPQPSVGKRGAFPARWVVVYARCAQRSTTRACDLYQYDPSSRTERRLSRLSTKGASERAPALQNGTYVFARIGGPQPGTYVATSRRVTRIDKRVAAATATDGVGHVAYIASGTVVAARASGQGKTEVAKVEAAFALFLTPGVRAGWLLRNSASGPVTGYRTDRLFRSYSPASVHAGVETLPPSTNSAVAGASSQIVLYLDRDGVRRPLAPIFAT